MNCPHCQAPAGPADNFCEACGAALNAPKAAHGKQAESCAGCGAGPEKIDADGYCSNCGLQRRHPGRDHLEIDVSPRLAGVSDRGIRHHRNEDFLAAAEAAGLLLGVVCDGVSNSQNADAASAAAAPAACDAFLAAWKNGGASDPEDALRKAILGAHAVVLAATEPGFTGDDPPESTIVAAAVIGSEGAREAVLGWLGDSRAYFVGPTTELQLTKDHSWLVEIVEAGKLTYEQAIRSRSAHSITMTLGGIPSEGEEHDMPSIVRCKLPEAGWVLLCSDGLWNYASELAGFASLVRRSAKSASPLDLSKELVEWARQQGGKDNITVVAMVV